MNLEKIKEPEFIKQLNIDELNDLATDIRQFLIENVSKKGGHFSSNLGIAELTMALHYVFHSPIDKFLFDVGHQSYVHKILTGRAQDFCTLRQFGGMSGFQKRKESIHDQWEAGHSSTAISAGIGMAIARDLNHDNGEIICIVGDGAITSGESFEALNYLGSIPVSYTHLLYKGQSYTKIEATPAEGYVIKKIVVDDKEHMQAEARAMMSMNRSNLSEEKVEVSTATEEELKMSVNNIAKDHEVMVYFAKVVVDEDGQPKKDEEGKTVTEELPEEGQIHKVTAVIKGATGTVTGTGLDVYKRQAI